MRYLALRHTRPHLVRNTTVHYTICTTPRLQWQLRMQLRYMNSMHHNDNYNCTTPNYIHTLGDVTIATIASITHLSVHQRIFFAMHSSQQLTSPLVSYLKLPPPRCAVVLESFHDTEPEFWEYHRLMQETFFSKSIVPWGMCIFKSQCNPTWLDHMVYGIHAAFFWNSIIVLELFFWQHSPDTSEHFSLCLGRLCSMPIPSGNSQMSSLYIVFV